jgi:outer membrane protein insertion porin family
LLWLSAGVLLSTARAEVPWYTGLPVAQVSLEATEGALPEQDLEPLLRVKQDELLRPAQVRQDLEMLQRLGRFAAVEAHAEPWVLFNDQTGEPEDAVWVIYRVYSPPRLRKVELTGVTRGTRRLVEGAIGLEAGEPFFAEEQLPIIEASIRAALAAEGWTEAQVSLQGNPDAAGEQVDLQVAVTLGEPRRFGEIVVGGDLVVPERRIRRWMRHEGIEEGERVVFESLGSARDRLLTELTRTGWRARPWQTRRHWLEARVNLIHSPGGPEGDQVSVLLESGPALELQVRGRGAPSSEALLEVLQLFPGDQIRPESLPDYEHALESWFQDRGYREAKATGELTEIPGGVRLKLTSRRGGLHTLRRIDVWGAQTWSEAYIGRALREADPETLGQGLVTDAGVQRAMQGVEEFYRGQGFLSAKLRQKGLLIEEVGLSRWRRGASASIVLQIEVEEGERTWLRTLVADGGLGVEAGLMAEARSALVADLSQPRPLSRAALERLRLDIADRYRESGYLNVDVQLDISLSRIDGESGALNVADAIIRIEPGSQVFLRSLIIQGNQRTRREVIEREVRIEVGDPITPAALAATRSGLYELGLFRVVSPQLVGDDDRARDLLLYLEERPNILLEGGGGVSTDQGIRATGRAVHRNIGGRAHRLSALGQVGYGWQSEGWLLDVDSPVWKAAVRYEAPGIPRQTQRLIIEGLINELTQEANYRLSRSGLSLGVGFERRADLQLQLTYQVQARRLEDVDPGVLVVGDPWLDVLDDPESPTLPSAWRLQGGPTLQLAWDGRDDRFNPTEGTFSSGSIQVADGLLSDVTNIRFSGRGERLWPVQGMVVKLGVLGGVGLSAAGSTLPLEDRFFLGGTDSLRGFALDTVGPANFTLRPDIDFPPQLSPLIDSTSLRDEPNRWVATGGDAHAAGSLELRVPLSMLGLGDWETTSAVLFSDFGQAFFLDRDITTIDSPDGATEPPVRYSVGFGIRQGTPIGPAALDIGFNPDPILDRDEASFVLHLSLGTL